MSCVQQDCVLFDDKGLAFGLEEAEGFVVAVGEGNRDFVIFVLDCGLDFVPLGGLGWCEHCGFLWLLVLTTGGV